MKRITVVSLVLVLLASFALLTACSGNESDKAYESWSKESQPKEKAANEELVANFTAAQEQGDRAGQVAVLEKYLGIAKPIRDQLTAIDNTKLSDKYKSAYDAELKKIDDGIKSLEENLAMQKDILAEEQQEAQAAEAPAPVEEAPVEEAPVEDEGYVEEDYDEAYEEE